VRGREELDVDRVLGAAEKALYQSWMGAPLPAAGTD
jgi:hypothetical protein